MSTGYGDSKSDRNAYPNHLLDIIAPPVFLILITLIYENSVAVPFVADDRLFIGSNKSIRSIGDLSAI